MLGPKTRFARELYAEKYLGEGETFEQAMGRITRAVSEGDNVDAPLYDALINQRFVPAGRVQSALGSGREVTPYNCFVSPTIKDSFVHGEDSIMDVATKAATTLRLGGGIGYDFSPLRPRGDLIRKLNSKSSGPISFIQIFDAVCACVQSAGHRRGAQMGVLRVDHPDVFEFIEAKRNSNSLTHFNISLAITDAFMSCVESGAPFPLIFEGRVHAHTNARELWDKIMESNWDWAEPGVIFIDRINQMNNLHYCETIAAVNPCSEQPLPPNGACLLGALNLTKYIRQDLNGWSMNYSLLISDVYTAVQMLDRVVDVAHYPLPEQKKEAQSKRRMGLGVMGLANALEIMGYEYGSPAFITEMKFILEGINTHAYECSISLAEEKGAFPLYDPRYLDGKFIKTLNKETQRGIKRFGIRNSHLTSIAPTGTISQCCDNVSSGIEPVFQHKYTRDVYMTEGKRTETIEDYAVAEFGVYGRTTDDVTVDEHLAVLCGAQQYVDSAISKTINVGKAIGREACDTIYLRAYHGSAKGCAIFNKDGKRMGILREVLTTEEKLADEGGACYIDASTGKKTCE
jgi:ribonucleoside-diphosphate reductase alpha chain